MEVTIIVSLESVTAKEEVEGDMARELVWTPVMGIVEGASVWLAGAWRVVTEAATEAGAEESYNKMPSSCFCSGSL